MSLIFFFNDTATTEIYTLSLHDALPIYRDRARPRVVLRARRHRAQRAARAVPAQPPPAGLRRQRVWRHRGAGDRKSTRLNSSHSQISYAVFCLKKKKEMLDSNDNESAAR